MVVLDFYSGSISGNFTFRYVGSRHIRKCDRTTCSWRYISITTDAACGDPVCIYGITLLCTSATNIYALLKKYFTRCNEKEPVIFHNDWWNFEIIHTLSSSYIDSIKMYEFYVNTATQHRYFVVEIFPKKEE